MQSIHEYYESIATTYDASRFGNTYGRYVDWQERQALAVRLKNMPPEEVVDLGCGTGRLLNYAMTGVDASAAMLDEAHKKHPGRELILASLDATGLLSGRYGAALCFHVFMHLNEAAIVSALQEAARILRPGGRMIFDIPSRPRRALLHRQTSGWHGDQAASLADVARWAGVQWRLVSWQGILFFPIHRLPAVLRRPLRRCDAWIGRTLLARWSSYYICELERL